MDFSEIHPPSTFASNPAARRSRLGDIVASTLVCAILTQLLYADAVDLVTLWKIFSNISFLLLVAVGTNVIEMRLSGRGTPPEYGEARRSR